MELENNRVSLTGYFSNRFEFSHEKFGEKFFIAELAVERLSGVKDFIPVMVSDRLIEVKEDYTGYPVKIDGQFRSYNKKEENRKRLILSVFATDIEFLDGYVVNADNNAISLDGYICKEPVYRQTPNGREIADLIVAVNRPYGKSDYIPCIVWGRNARYASSLEVGTHIALDGRIQSREYIKKLDGGQTETKVAYEVSVGKIEVVEDEKDNN